MLLEVNTTDLDDVLFDRLTGLDEAGLAAVLATRPDVLDPPWPRRLENVVRRLCQPESIVLAIRTLAKPEFQALRAIRVAEALGMEVTLTEVAGLLGAPPGDLVSLVDGLAARLLAWPGAGGKITVPDSHGIAVDFAGLGVSIAEFLPQRTVEQLKALGQGLGVPVDGRKAKIVEELLEFYREPAMVVDLVNGAPAGVAELLAGFIVGGPERELEFYGSYHGYRRGAPESPAGWAIHRGLLWQIDHETAHLPMEVGLALRGPDYRLPFTPHRPQPAVGPVPAEAVAAETATAALRLLDRVGAILDHTATHPIPLLKSGQVGARGIKALAKETSSTVEETKLAVWLAIQLRMLAPVEPEPEPEPVVRRRGSRLPPPEPVGIVPTDRFAAWRACEAATRLRALLGAWWTLPLAPLADEKQVRAVLGNDGSAAFTDVRQLTLRLLTALPAGTGLLDGDSLVDLVSWHAPLVSTELVGTLVRAALAEATLLGLVGAGAPGEPAHALVAATPSPGRPVDPEEPGLVKVTDRLVAGARTTALFGADLTAVVTGPPDTALAELLDLAAARESHGAASTWRFSPTTVRAALDGGTTAAELLEELGAAAGKELPQPLVYLINDVARRHGEVGVHDVGCVIVGQEPGLLAELAAHRRLAALHLRQVAPTVLTSAGTAADTVAALRAAGYAPVQHGVAGAVRVRPAAPVPLDEPGPDELPAADPREHAARLLRAPARSAAPRRHRGELLNQLLRARSEQRTGQWVQFAWHLESGLPTMIQYAEPDGGRSELLISAAELTGDALDVWCEQTAEYRRLELARISPA